MNKTILMACAVAAGMTFANSALAQQTQSTDFNPFFTLRIQQTETIFSGATAPSRFEIQRQRRLEQRTREGRKSLRRLFPAQKN